MEQLNPPAAAETGPKARPQRDMDVLVGYILLYGVMSSLVLIVAGLVWRWLKTGQLWLDYEISGMNLFQFVLEEFRLAAHGAVRPRLLVNLGIAVLMLTPFLRVIASMFYFLAVLNNRKYTLFTLMVLLVLTYSLFLRY